jgi:UDP-glucose 4-epimerase
LQLSGKRILVTGAAGFIGSHLADALAKDSELLLVDDFSIGLRENLAQLADLPNVRIVETDIREAAAMRELCRGIDVIFHMAISCLRTSLAQPVLSHDTNAGGSLSVCLAARDCGVSRLVYVSSSEVYGTARVAPMAESHPLEPTTIYGASKLAGELYALASHRTYGLPALVVRPFNTYGPREPWQGERAEVIPRFILQLEAGRSPVVYGDGTQTRDFTYVEDTVRGLRAAAECDALVGDVVNVARGREISILRIAELLAGLLGRESVPVRFEPGRPGDVKRHYADIGKARRLFGYAPSVDFEDGLAKTVAWFRANRIASRAAADASEKPNW